MVVMSDSTTPQTPVEVDTRLADITAEQMTLSRQIDSAWRMIHDYAGDYQQKMTHDDAYRYALALGDYRADGTGREKGKIQSLEQSQRALHDEAGALNAIYDKSPWPRFYIVQNTGGHIHSSIYCSTCNKNYKATNFGWMTDLSGKSEKEAVDALGPILCSVCFPSAPVDWTNGHEVAKAKREEGKCAGGGKTYNGDLPHRTGYYSGNWGTCEVCGDKVSITSTGKLRAHKRK